MNIDAVRANPKTRKFLKHKQTNRSLPVWKISVVVFLFAFTFVLNPWHETAHGSITSEQLLEAINSDREKDGLAPLVFNKKLELAAVNKAQNMFKYDYFAHVSPRGEEPWNFIKEAGFRYAYAGENLALNYLDSYELHHDFLASPSHRENILSPLFTEIGIAVVRGEFEGEEAIITVQMFAQPTDSLAAK